MLRNFFFFFLVQCQGRNGYTRCVDRLQLAETAQLRGHFVRDGVSRRGRSPSICGRQTVIAPSRRACDVFTAKSKTGRSSNTPRRRARIWCVFSTRRNRTSLVRSAVRVGKSRDRDDAKQGADDLPDHDATHIPGSWHPAAMYASFLCSCLCLLSPSLSVCLLSPVFSLSIGCLCVQRSP